MDGLKERAYGKINLALDVLGTLPNGYHEVRMIMQTVDIWDELVFEKEDAGITILTDCGELPTDGNNLIHKAVKLMQEEFGVFGGARIRLRKNIPVAAGMAGGSADAAAAMKGFARLYGLEASRERLMELGVRIGADVPYCILGGTALAEGIGERLTQLPPAPQCTLVVAKPDRNVSTKEVYTRLDSREEIVHPDIDGMIASVQTGDLEGIAARLANVLEPVTEQLCPAVGRIRSLMLRHGALGSLMSGSGPTVFGIFDDRSKAQSAAEAVKGSPSCQVKQSFVTEFVRVL